MGAAISPAAQYPTDKDGTKMSDRHIEDIRISWLEVKKFGPEKLGEIMFRRLFIAAPETLKVFENHLKMENWLESVEFHHHCRTMMSITGSAVGLFRNSQTLSDSLHYLGRKHHGMNITQHHFDLLGIELNNALVEVLTPEKYTNEVKEAWNMVYKIITDKIIQVMAMEVADLEHL